MDTQQVIALGNEFMLTALILVAPPVITSLLVGLLISVFQTLTSIQEQTLSFAPRICAVAVVLMFSLPWALSVLVSYSERVFGMIETVNR